jgi:hypothetical protein
MNTLGKLFVIATFSMSLLFLALAIGVYSNHIQWTKETQAAQKSILEKTQAKINEMAYSRERATARYRTAYESLVRIEALRAQRKAFYDVKFEILKSGKDAKGQPVPNPVQELEMDKDGVVEMKPIGAPSTIIQIRGTPLLPLDAAENKLAALNKQILAEQEQITALQNQLKKLTTDMQGGPNEPGLIKEQEIQVDAKKRVIDEQENLKPILANRYGEAVLLLKREAALRKRLELLEKGGTAVSVIR